MKNRFSLLLLVLVATLALTGTGLATDDGLPHGSNLSTVAPNSQQGSRAPGSLTTIFASNNGYAGNTIDIIPARSLQITGIDVNVDPAGSPTTVDVYYKAGTATGFESNSAAWTLLASGTGTAAGTDLPTFIDLPAAGGINFDAGATYGLYIDVVSYPTPGINYTNGGPNTYSNADLTIITNSGQPSPAFGSPFLYRAWNGTIYYDDGGPDFPRVDIKCNGQNSGVTMYAGTNAVVDFSVHAGIGVGTDVDIWVLAKGPFGKASYNGAGPWGGWSLGTGNAYMTGPLADVIDTCHLGPLDIGMYKAFIGIDTKANGVINKGAFFAMDIVDVDVQAPPKIYAWDDGSTENLLAWTSGGDMCWLDGWTAYAGGETLLDMHCMFGSAMYPGYAPGNGSPCTGYIWDDPTNDSDPSDCTLMATEPLTVAQVDTDLYNIFPLTAPTVVSGVFFVGCVMPHGPGQYCLPMDQTGPYTPGTCWYCGTTTMGGFDPNDLMLNQYTPAEYGVNFCIRAGY